MAEININFIENERKGFMDNKGKGFLMLQAEYGYTPGYCWICSEHQKFVRGSMRYFIDKHNIKSSLVQWIHANLDAHGQYNCNESAPRNLNGVYYATQVSVGTGHPAPLLTTGSQEAGPGRLQRWEPPDAVQPQQEDLQGVHQVRPQELTTHVQVQIQVCNQMK